MPEYPKPPYPAQRQPMPGATAKMNPRPDHGETSYKGSGKLAGKKAVITGGDSGIGRAVAIAYAREGADILIAYLDEHQDAQEVKGLVEHEGRKAVLVAGDLRSPQHCRAVIKQAVDVLGGIDILINNAAHQATFKDIGDISDEEWQLTFEVNIHAMFYLTKAAVPHMKPGSAIINTGSVTGIEGSKYLLDYSMTKGGIHAFTRSLSANLIPKGIRVNCVAPGPVWTPLNPADRQADDVAKFGQQSAMKRAAQPEEIAPAYVFLAAPSCSSYITGEIVPIIGGYSGG